MQLINEGISRRPNDSVLLFPRPVLYTFVSMYVSRVNPVPVLVMKPWRAENIWLHSSLPSELEAGDQIYATAILDLGK